MGLLFESMAVRDLRVYSQSLGARLYYYADDSGLESDAVIDGLDGQWAAVEVKLGGGRVVAKAMETLRTMRSRVDTVAAASLPGSSWSPRSVMPFRPTTAWRWCP